MRVEDLSNAQLNKKAVSFNGDFEIQDKKDSWVRYVINGVLMFYIAYGCIGTFASAFEIEHFKGVLFLVMLLLSLLYSFMHVSEMTHRVGYVCILVCYLYMILKMKTIIKSGFATIINITLKVIQDKLDLARIKQYTEYVDETELSVTMCMIVIGFVLLLVLNIFISEYMNVICTVILTAPVVVSSYYFEQRPSLLPLILYVAGIIGILVMRLNNKCTVYNDDNEYYIDNEDAIEKKYVYVVANRMHAHLLVVVIVSVTMLSGVFSLALKDNYKHSFFVKTFMKDLVDEQVTNMVTDTGGGGSKKAASGGLSKGKLGSVASIEYDNKTDLKVKLVPESDESIYLRGYIGSVYEENTWKMLERAESKKYLSISKDIEDLYNISPNDRAGYSFQLLENTPVSIFTVENVDANGEYAFLPYYAELNNKCMDAKSDDEMFMKVNALSYEVRFHQNTSRVAEKIDNNQLTSDPIIEGNMNKYYSQIKDIYTVVPKENKEVIKEIIKEIGLEKKSSYTNEEINDIASKIQQYYKSGYIYTLSPGETPEGEDYINYFLNTKKGFCAHYASAATMIMRYMGVAARYVEGYVISSDLINGGTIVGGKDVRQYTSNYKAGESKLIEIEIPDNKAHAWIEVYKENFGWVPIEMTVYREREEKRITSGDLVGKEIQKLKSNLVESGKKSLYIIAIMTVIMMCITAVMIVRYIIKRVMRKKVIYGTDKTTAIVGLYKYLCDVLGYFGAVKDKGMTIDEHFINAYNKGLAKKEILEEIASNVKKVAYSNEIVKDEDYIYVKTQVENIVKIQYNELSLKDKIKFKYIYNL